MKLITAQVGVRQGFIFSPTIFNVFPEYIIMEVFDGFEGTVGIGGCSTTNLRSADEIDLVADKSEELIDLTSRHEESAKMFGRQISAEKRKVISMGTNEAGKYRTWRDS